MSATELAWAAGFFDGEGTTGAFRDNHHLYTTVSQVDRRSLDRFRLAVGGLGNIGGPYSPQRLSKKPHWTYRAYSASALGVVRALWPYLGEAKQEQALRALIHHAFRPIGNQALRALGRCLRGHPVKPDGWYVDPSGQRECPRCRDARRGGPLARAIRPLAIDLRVGVREYIPGPIPVIET